MAKGFAIHNAPTDHGGFIPSTQVRNSQQGNLFVRAGDGHFCPKCKCWSTIIKSHDHVIFDGKAVAYVGDKLTCGARIQPQQSHVVGDSGGAYYDSSLSTIRPVSSQKNLNNSLVESKKDLLNGYYYNVDTGFYEGKITSGEGDLDNVYTFISKISDQEYNDIKKVPIQNHIEFIKKASTAYGESTAYRSENTEELKYEIFAIAFVHEKNHKAFGVNSEQAKLFRSKTPETRNNTKMQLAIAGVINALNKGVDYSNGADMWDGKEQALFPASDNRKSTGVFELHMNTMGWTISDEHYAKWKKAVGKLFVAPQHRPAPDNYGGYKNKGKMRLKSTAVYNGTIFWSSK